MMQETVLVTGGASGIGRGLAGAFHALGARVIIAGRDMAALQAVVAGHPGMVAEHVDVMDSASITALAARVATTHPGLTMVINNAGLQQVLDFTQAVDPAAIAREVATNLTGLMQVSAAFVPMLMRQPRARLVHVGSGLGYVPLVQAPVYSATKAGVHSFSISLRQQLRGTSVQVVEIIPPAVETALHRGQARKPPGVMPLDAFVAKTMAGLAAGHDEVRVGLARVLAIGVRVAPGLFLRIINKGG
jgi:uncharacterized oxidoreductase